MHALVISGRCTRLPLRAADASAGICEQGSDLPPLPPPPPPRRVLPLAQVSWGKLEERFRRPWRARQCYAKAAAEDPLNYFAWQCLGVLEAKSGHLDAARALFKKCTGKSRVGVELSWPGPK